MTRLFRLDWSALQYFMLLISTLTLDNFNHLSFIFQFFNNLSITFTELSTIYLLPLLTFLRTWSLVFIDFIKKICVQVLRLIEVLHSLSTYPDGYKYPWLGITNVEHLHCSKYRRKYAQPALCLHTTINTWRNSCICSKCKQRHAHIHIQVSKLAYRPVRHTQLSFFSFP